MNKSLLLKSQNVHRYEWSASHVVVTGTLRRGYKSNLTVCVNSLPQMRSLLFIVFLFWDIWVFEDLRRMVENLTLHLSSEGWFHLLPLCLFPNSCVIHNPWQNWKLKAKDDERKLDEEHSVKVVFQGREAWELKLENFTIIQHFKDIQKLYGTGHFCSALLCESV